ncbi:MAG: hypothetical protein B6243_05850 [Anaerolineaceae bacterium 4572_5.2]|nr:MAG: hypothetical protein B6243_05850 [Anaerolineaceae bacterium 4572_5.2]
MRTPTGFGNSWKNQIGKRRSASLTAANTTGIAGCSSGSCPHQRRTPDGRFQRLAHSGNGQTDCHHRIIQTDDALLICPRDKAQDVKKIVNQLKQTKQAYL